MSNYSQSAGNHSTVHNDLRLQIQRRNRKHAADSREIAHELLQRMAAFLVIDKRLNGDPGSYQHWSTSQNVRVGVNDRRPLHWKIRNDVTRMLLRTLRGR